MSKMNFLLQRRDTKHLGVGEVMLYMSLHSVIPK